MDKRELFSIADRQQGFFTFSQALSCGLHKSSFERKLASGEWIREQRGVYLLANYPVTERPELVIWSLWSRDREGIPQGVWSHETALDIFNLGGAMPTRMHMTVPKHFRRRAPTPSILQFYFEDLEPTDVIQRRGFCITTPLKTLEDVVAEGTMSLDLIVESVEQALREGLLSGRQLLDGSKQLREIVNDHNL